MFLYTLKNNGVKIVALFSELNLYIYILVLIALKWLPSFTINFLTNIIKAKVRGLRCPGYGKGHPTFYHHHHHRMGEAVIRG